MEILNMISGIDLSLFFNMLQVLGQLAQAGPASAWVIASPFILWVFFLAYMALKAAKKRAPLYPVANVMSKPVEWIGGLFDFFVNVVFMSIILMERPQEFLVTSRLSRLSSDPGYRGVIARWMGRHLLDPFDPDGVHLKYKKQLDGSEPTLQL